MKYINPIEKHNEANIVKGLSTFGKKFVKDFKKFGQKTADNWRSSFEHHDIKDDIIKFVNKLKSELDNYDKKNLKHMSSVNIPENVAKERALKILDKNIEEIRLDLTPGEISILSLDTLFRKIKRKLQLDDHNLEKEFKDFLNTLDYRVQKLTKYRVENDGDIKDEFSRLGRKEYEEEKLDLQAELLKLQEWAIENNKRICIVFEGRDAAGKGSSIKRFTEYLIPNASRTVALGIPSEWEKNHWFERYEKHLPDPGEIVFFDRSWYNRAVVEPVMGYCNEEQYEHFMDNVVQWEENLIDNGMILIKFWFSITQDKQLLRFDLRKKSRVKHWKFSENDLKSINKWEEITKFKERMFRETSTEKTPWVVVDSNDKKIARLNAMRYVLSNIDYDGKDHSIEAFSDVVHVIT